MDTESAQVALITGANRGIGYESAAQLAQLGWRVLLGSRDPERGALAARRLSGRGGDVRPVTLDVTDEAAVRTAADLVATRFGRLDCLVNNAGILLETEHRPSLMSAHTMRRTFETNVFGVVTVLDAMLPLLRRAPVGRVVNLSSTLGSPRLVSEPLCLQSRFRLLAYNSSKGALNAVTALYANDLRGSRVKVNAVDPGFCATDINDHRGSRTAAEGARVVVELATIGPDGPSGGFFNAEGQTPW
jgi:NAD(P)-dependent dehydrogenase (short-subunit alcohol dehydrogenase family)